MLTLDLFCSLLFTDYEFSISVRLSSRLYLIGSCCVDWKAEESSQKESAPAAKKVKKSKPAKDDAATVIDHAVIVLQQSSSIHTHFT